MRNFGIELFRVVMMLGIVSLHYLGHGGLLGASSGGDRTLLWLVESLGYFSVNGFVLITGYFQSKGKFKAHKLITLLLQVIFWSLVTYAVAVVAGDVPLSIVNLVKACFPFLFGGYWFATAYMALYLLSPYLNKLLDALSQKEQLALTAIFTALCACPLLGESLGVNGGYGLLWFIALYLWGAYVGKYPVRLLESNWICGGMLAVCVGVLWGSQVLPVSALLRSVLWSYASLPVLVAAICCFLLFLRIRLPQRLGRAIGLVSPLTLGVYLVHDGEFIREVLWDGVRSVLTHETILSHLWLFPLVVLAVFSAAALAELVRAQLFRLLRVQKIVERITG